MDAVRWLRESGVTVAQREVVLPGASRVDAVLDITLGDQSARFAVEVKQRAPYPGELKHLQSLRMELSQWGEPLLVIPYMREETGIAISHDGWSWADSLGNFDLRAPGLVLRQRRPAKPPKAARASLPRGSGSFAVMRALLSFRDGEEEETGATALANQAGVSQPRASQILRQLWEQDLAERAEHGRWRPRRDVLLERFLSEYPGPGGEEQYFYTLDSLADIAVGAARKYGDQIAVSADTGPDLVVAWRRPSALIVYARGLIDPSSLGLVEAQGRDDANVIIRIPRDRSVFGFPPLVAALHGFEISLADPTQMVWDLFDLGGADRAEAAGRLQEWLLTSR